MKAPEILKQAAKHIEDRAAKRDKPDGERSMGKTVAAFNAVTGNSLSERDGWVFMQMVKLARACTTPSGSPDDYEDAAAFSALAGEAASATSADSVALDYYMRNKPIERVLDGRMRPDCRARGGCPENTVCDYCQLSSRSLRDSIVQPDGTVGDIDRSNPTGWKNGASSEPLGSHSTTVIGGHVDNSGRAHIPGFRIGDDTDPRHDDAR